jgi:hypothetical protein
MQITITINIDDRLLEIAAKLANIENQSEVIELALNEFILRHPLSKKHDISDIVD